MKKLVIGFITGMVLFIGAAAIAYANDWITFNGDNQIIETESDIDEIMQILRNVNSDKITAEQAVKELQDLNPKGLAKQNQELRDRVNELKGQLETAQSALAAKDNEINEKNQAYDKLQQERDGLESTIDGLNAQITELQNASNSNSEYVKHLENEIERANNKVAELNNKSGAALQEAQEIGGNE